MSPGNDKTTVQDGVPNLLGDLQTRELERGVLETLDSFPICA